MSALESLKNVNPARPASTTVVRCTLMRTGHREAARRAERWFAIVSLEELEYMDDVGESGRNEAGIGR